MNEHIEWIMENATWSTGKTVEASNRLHALNLLLPTDLDSRDWSPNTNRTDAEKSEQ